MLRVVLPTTEQEGTVYLLLYKGQGFDSVWSPKVQNESIEADEQAMAFDSKCSVQILVVEGTALTNPPYCFILSERCSVGNSRAKSPRSVIISRLFRQIHQGYEEDQVSPCCRYTSHWL